MPAPSRFKWLVESALVLSTYALWWMLLNQCSGLQLRGLDRRAGALGLTSLCAVGIHHAVGLPLLFVDILTETPSVPVPPPRRPRGIRLAMFPPVLPTGPRHAHRQRVPSPCRSHDVTPAKLRRMRSENSVLLRPSLSRPGVTSEMGNDGHALHPDLRPTHANL